MTTETPWQWYNERAAALAEQYEELNAADVYGWLNDLLPAPSAVILDVGAGSGRDAAWLAGLGHEVVAVEPSAALRAEAISRHDHPRVRWLSDRLPGLEVTHRLGLCFDVILLSAVWMHVPPVDRARAFRKLITLLKPRGVLALTLRQGPAEPERGFHPVAAAELEQLARQHGAFIERCVTASDQLGRQEVTWIQMAIRLPDDGTGALPLLRHVILNDDKSSTYKLALLRALCRLADGSAGFAQDDGDDAVSIPLGLVGLYWLRLYLPLLRANLPQSPTHMGLSRLGFVREPFRALMGVMAQQDLRIGMSFGESTGRVLHEALRDACDTIVRMPAHFMTYPGGGQIFPVARAPRTRMPNPVVISRPYLASFGELRIPKALWQALQRFTVWVEPALVTEWIRLTTSYAERQHRALDDAALQRAMAWSEPERDVGIARQLAMTMLAETPLQCVWSGKPLSVKTVDIDHCFPWSVWPCGDLWNLLPVDRRVNQHQKRNRLPSETLLRAARAAIQSWWNAAYLTPRGASLAALFVDEARASLPALNQQAAVELDDISVAMSLQRLRLKNDQQVPEWCPDVVTERPV